MKWAKGHQDHTSICDANVWREFFVVVFVVVVFGGSGGCRLTSVILISHGLSVSLRFPVGHARCWMSEPSWRKNKGTLFQHMSGRRVWLCAPVYEILCACLLYWHCSVSFLTVMIGGLHKLTGSEEENESKNGRQGWEENESNRAWVREKKSHCGDATVDHVRSFSFSSPLSPAITVFQSRVTGWLFDTAGQPHWLSPRK